TDPRLKDILKEGAVTGGDEGPQDNLISNRTKTFVKRWPRFYNFLKKTVGPSHSPGSGYNLRSRLKELFGNNIKDKIVLNLGSGTNRIHPDIINVDLFAFKEVDVVADIRDMPFKDASVDGIICEDVLEHVAHT